MKLNKKHKLNLLILLCLAIILILIYLKDKKIDLFGININTYSINKYLRSQDLENELQRQMNEQELKIKHLTEDTQIVLNGSIMPIRTTTTQPSTTEPLTTQYYRPILQPADQEVVTDSLKSNSNNNTDNTNVFAVPFVQPPFTPITEQEARTECSNDFNNINSINENCKLYAKENPTVGENLFNTNLEQCITDLVNNGTSQPYLINENIQNVISRCNERKIFEEGHNDLTTYYFI